MWTNKLKNQAESLLMLLETKSIGPETLEEIDSKVIFLLSCLCDDD